MMSTSNYQISTSGRTERTPQMVKRADRFRAVLGALWGGRLHCLPIAGSLRAKQRKVAGELNISIDETARLLAHRDGSSAMPLLRALLEDAGINHLDIHNCAPVAQPRSLADAENELTACFAAFFADADSVRRNKRASSIEMRRLIEEEMGLEGRARAILNAPEFGADNA